MPHWFLRGPASSSKQSKVSEEIGREQSRSPKQHRRVGSTALWGGGAIG
jgi:hypothetical protein